MATLPRKVSDSPDSLSTESLNPESLHLVPPSADSSPAVLTGLRSFWRTDHTRWIHKEFIATDFLCLLFSACAAVYGHLALSHFRPDLAPVTEILNSHLALLLLMAFLVVLFCQNYGLYRARRTRTFAEEAGVVCKSIVLSLILIVGFTLLSAVEPLSWGTLLSSVAMDTGLMVGWRYYEFSRTQRHIAAGVGTKNVLIVGAGALGKQVAARLERNRHLGYVVKGFIDDVGAGDNLNVLGKVEDLSQVARAHFIDEVVIALPWESQIAARATIEARKQRLNVKLVPNFYGGLEGRAPLEYLGDVPAFSLHREPIPAIALLAKRMIDRLFSAIALVALAPLFGIIALLVKFDSPGPVLYRSTRVGKKGRKFIFYKFRTMVVNADELKQKLRAHNERCGPFFKMANDPRMTRIGRYLRRYSLDELPQFWNVLKGDMSLVGPRPHPLDDYQQYGVHHLRRLDVMPGITGLWQVQARHDSSWETNMQLDLHYIEHWTPWMDIKIMFKTFPVVLKGLGQ